MGKPVASYPSKSSPGKEYHIIEAADGSFYCDCWQWKRNKYCKHLDHFNKSVVSGIVSGIDDIIVSAGNIPKQEANADIDNIINKFFPA